MTVQFLDAALYPTITVELGVSDSSSNGGTWGYSLWGTGTWTDLIAWTDISDKVRNLTTSWARSRDLNLQPANVLSLILDNRDGRFSPGNTAGPFAAGGVSKIRPRIAVRVTAVWNSVTYPLYYGFISNWTDQPSGYGADMVAQVQATDALSLLTLNKVTGSNIGARGDSCTTRAAAILTAATWPLASALDVGSSTLDVDTTTDSALALLQNVATADGGGLIWADRDGTLTFHGQTHRGPYVATSTTSRAIGTGSKSFTVAAGLPIQAGDLITAAGSYSTTGATPTNYMSGTVTSYSGTTLTLNVTATGGSGTIATWYFWWTRSFLPQMTFGGSGLNYDEPKLSNDDVYFYNTIVVTPQASTSTTSTTSTTVGTGSKTFTISSASAGYVVGDTVVITSTGTSANTMTGAVTAYTGTSLTVNVTSKTGSGTNADWSIALAASNIQTAIDSDSVSLYTTRTLSVSSWGQSSTAATLASTLLRIYSQPEYRVDGLRVTPAVDPSTLWPLVLDARINDRHSVTIPLPTTTYVASISRIVHVAGISHSISLNDGWRITFDYSSATPYL